MIVKAETVIAWHRKGFRLFWMWRIRRDKPGRPSVPQAVRDLIRMLSRNNPRWGAPRIHGELWKLGVEITEPTVAKYMERRRKPPSQTWRTFLANHVQTMVSIDFFTVPTIRFNILYVFLVLAHERRRIVHFAVTAHPTAEWTVQQLRETFPWDSAPTISTARSGSHLRAGLRRSGKGDGLPTLLSSLKKDCRIWASARPWMPYAHEPVNPARHARRCAWLRAASRLLSQGFDNLFATGLFWLCQKGQERPFLAFFTRRRMLMALLAAL